MVTGECKGPVVGTCFGSRCWRLCNFCPLIMGDMGVDLGSIRSIQELPLLMTVIFVHFEFILILFIYYITLD